MTWVSASTAAQVLHVHPETLRRYAQEGMISPDAIKLTPGGHRRYDLNKLQASSVSAAWDLFFKHIDQAMRQGYPLATAMESMLKDNRFIQITSWLDAIESVFKEYPNITVDEAVKSVGGFPEIARPAFEKYLAQRFAAGYEYFLSHTFSE